MPLQKGHGICQNPLVGIEPLTSRLGQETTSIPFTRWSMTQGDVVKVVNVIVYELVHLPEIYSLEFIIDQVSS